MNNVLLEKLLSIEYHNMGVAMHMNIRINIYIKAETSCEREWGSAM